jgi:D-aspartate ligase
MARPTAEDATPVLVLGSGVTALGVCRVLGESEIPAHLVSADRDFARWSRWAHPIEFGGVESPDPDLLESFLEPLPFERAVLIACSDTWVRAVAGLSSEIRDRFPASVPSADTVHVLTDKGQLSEVLQRLGVPMPETVTLQGPQDLDDLSDGELALRFLKPRDSQAFSQHFRKKAFSIRNRSDARQLLEETQRVGLGIIAQEYIPGPTTNQHYIDGFIDRSGTLRALFARQKMFMYPIDFGNSTLMVSESLDSVRSAVSDLLRLLADLSYRGIFSAEFKLDERDGRFKLLEVNARPWWFIEFASRAGVNIPVLAYEDALGLDVVSIEDYEVNKKHMLAPQHLRALLALRKEHKVTVRSWLGSTWGASDAISRWSDPLPAVAMAAGYVREGFSRSWGHRSRMTTGSGG